MKFFCSILKKIKRTAQVDMLVKAVADEDGNKSLTSRNILRIKCVSSTKVYMHTEQ